MLLNAPCALPRVVGFTLLVGYSGSDIVSMCKYAAMIPVRELLDQHTAATPTAHTADPLSPSQLRPLTLSDLEQAVECVPPTARDQERAAEEDTS